MSSLNAFFELQNRVENSSYTSALVSKTAQNLSIKLDIQYFCL